MLRSHSPRLLAASLCVAATAHAAPQQDADRPAPRPSPAFVSNAGQWPADVAAQARSGAGTAWFHDRGVVLVLEQGEPADLPATHDAPLVGPGWRSTGTAVVRMAFAGGARAVDPDGVGDLPGTRSFARGADRSRWIENAPAFAALRYREVWPGIDAVFRSADAELVYDFELAPWTASEGIEIACEGIERLSIRADGALVMHTELGDVVHGAPQSFEIGPDGVAAPVPSRFVLRGATRYGFEVDRSDRGLPLRIDPGIDWSTFLGGTEAENTVHTDRLAPRRFATSGFTMTALPAPWSSNPAAGGVDSHVTILDLSATGAAAVVASTLLGGSDDDYVLDMDFDATTGLITVVGLTRSTDFPVTANALQPTFGGIWDGFVAQLDAQARVVYASYLGTDREDRLAGVSVDRGVVTVIGATIGDTWPVAGTPFRSRRSGGFDIVVSRIDPTLVGPAQLIASSYVGGPGDEAGFINPNVYFKNWDIMVVDVSAQDELTLAFLATSGFPTTANAYRTTWSGGWDTVVARLDGGLSNLSYATYVGGDLYDLPMEMDVDDGGMVTVIGVTRSTTFPTTPGALQSTIATTDRNDSFVFQLDPSRTGAQQLRYSSYFGGALHDEWYGLGVEPGSGVRVISGYGSAGLPITPGAFQTSHAAQTSGVVARLWLDGNGAAAFHYLSYVGHATAGTGIYTVLYECALDFDGRAVLVGETNSPTAPVGPGGPQPTYGGGDADGLVFLMDLLPTGVTPIGAASPACAPAAWMQVSSQPAAGNAGFSLMCENAPPQAAGLLAFGPANPAGTPVLGIDLYLGVLVAIPAAADGNGSARVALPLPAGLAVPLGAAAQFVWVQPTPCGAGTPLSASNALGL